VEVIVEYDYTATEPDELTIKKGDIIKNVIKKQEGWWEGTLKDKKGLFPDNFVRMLDKDSSIVLRNKKDVSRIRQCRVVFSYNQNHEDELNLNVGDIIDILGEEEEGWWRGTLGEKKGVFPSNFVEEILWQPHPPSRDDFVNVAGEIDSKAPKLPAKPVKILCEAKFPYKAQNEDELSFKEGDTITLLNKDSQDAGWWQGELNGKIGVFPDNFVVLITSDGKNRNKEENKSSRIVTETGAIKPSSIASQRKSLDLKSNKLEKPAPEPAVATTKTTPPIPGKKPTSIKKSPSSTGSALFSEIKKKLVDVVDGATASKTVTSKTEVENHDENAFDQVERRPLLTDIRATRAKAPGRRPPKSIHKDDDPPIPNGNADHIDHPDASHDSLSETDGEKPRVREWERHKAPWLEEMKISQAKRTSTSPGAEHRLKLTPTSDVGVEGEEHEEEEGNKASPNDREVDMSKSMPSMDLSKAFVPKPKTPPEEPEKVPMLRTKPAIPTVITNRHSVIGTAKELSSVSSVKELSSVSSIKELSSVSSVTTRHTANVASKETIVVRQTVTTPPKTSPSVASKLPPAVILEKEVTSEDLPDVVARKEYLDVLERLRKLEVTVERQSQAIEELRNRLQVETDMRMLLQEKVVQNVQV
ncbi:unnamed protein product, partial [Phaedon cochleariae]